MNDHVHIRGNLNANQKRTGKARPFPIASRKGVGGPTPNAKKLGAKNQLPTWQDTPAPLADLLSRGQKEVPLTGKAFERARAPFRRMAVRLYPELVNPSCVLSRIMVILDVNLRQSNDELYHSISKDIILAERAEALLKSRAVQDAILADAMPIWNGGGK